MQLLEWKFVGTFMLFFIFCMINDLLATGTEVNLVEVSNQMWGTGLVPALHIAED